MFEIVVIFACYTQVIWLNSFGLFQLQVKYRRYYIVYVNLLNQIREVCVSTYTHSDAYCNQPTLNFAKT